MRGRCPGSRSVGGTSLAGSIVAKYRANPPRDREPLAPRQQMHVDRESRPGQRQLGGDALRAGPVEELDEPLEQPTVLRHREAEPATDAR